MRFRLTALILSALTLCSLTPVSRAGEVFFRDGEYNVADFQLTDIYETPEVFEDAARTKLLSARLAALDGKLENPDALAGFARLLEDAEDEFTALYAYAYMSRAADNTDETAQERLAAVKRSGRHFEEKLTPLASQVLQLEKNYLSSLVGDPRFDEKTLSAWINADKEKPVTFNEKLAALFSLPSEIAETVLGADFNPALTTRGVPATAAELALALSGGDADYRREVYEKYYASLNNHRHTLAAALNAHVSGRVLRNSMYNDGYSYMERVFLFDYEMPPETVDVLIASVTELLPLYREFARVSAEETGKRKILPYEKNVRPEARAGTYSYPQACEIILKSLAPLGVEVVSAAERVLTGGHVNHVSSPLKQGGAFCIPAGNRADPYIHLNFDGSLSSVCTLAHELGHAVNMILSKNNSPPTTIVTETAAILNEILLLRYLNDEAAHLSHIDLLCATLFQQTRFLSFEKEIYALITREEILTPEKADALWKKTGEPFASGYTEHLAVSDGAWAGIPHFYRDFYVATYAFAAAAAERLANLPPEITVNFLSAGNSTPAYTLFQKIGVDFLNKKAYNDIGDMLASLADERVSLNKPDKAA